MNTVDRVNRILEDVERKSKSLNGLFQVIDGVTDTLSVFTDSIVSGVTSVMGMIFPKRKKRKKEKENEDYE